MSAEEKMKQYDYDARRVIKINHSLLITLPVRMTRELNLQVGDYVEIQLERDKLIVRPLSKAGKNQG